MITYCQLKPCFNNGTCVEQFFNGYSCECLEGFTGNNCETKIDLCEGWLCLNNGTCIVHRNVPVCHCQPRFSGEHCEIDISSPCDDVTCLNGGTCYVENDEAFCKCLPGYTGARCETHLTKCEEFPEPLLCLNGGSCIVTNHQQHCECALGFFGNNCDVFGRSCAAITCQGGGTCVNDTTLQGHCICPPERTGEFCETEKTSSFNLYFNGQRSSQEVVSKDFSSTLLREFTLCAWVFYAPIEQPSTDVGLGAFLQLNTTSRTPILSIDNTGVTINKNFYIDVKLSTMAWHHVCVRSPLYQADVDRPIWTVFLDGVLAANTSYPLLDVTADIRCLIQLSSSEEPRFRGEISLAQLYIAYLNDTDIARMAFQCSNWTAAPNPDLHLKWTDFTTIQRNNPGVMALYPGLCDVSDCLPGRSSCNTKGQTSSSKNQQVLPLFIYLFIYYIRG
ncbi:unnamed protein product [Heligmosomoides polygyrus]|uniref:EGF-like domain-containing protein n=1 Tax=Heligmosomoides polygyrus TaxID=6339 RepID=A0A3P8AJG7_HELPZ|nr:unnamed protein product [Heligmosomoides polygyrus]